jgi:hypothetical protein
VPSSAVVELDPDLIILAPCGLNLEMTRREAATLSSTDWWASLRAVREGRVAIVDGDAMFNRPGPRLVDALEWLYAVINDEPGAAPDNFPAEWLPAPQHDGRTTAGAPPADDAAALLHDIEEAHSCAVRAGKLQYTDPQTGYTVFTQLASSQRGYCCGSGCRHCVYGHANVPPERRAKLKRPITCEV